MSGQIYFENVEAVAALEYLKWGKIVEGYGKKCQEAATKLSCFF